MIKFKQEKQNKGTARKTVYGADDEYYRGIKPMYGDWLTLEAIKSYSSALLTWKL